MSEVYIRWVSQAELLPIITLLEELSISATWPLAATCRSCLYTFPIPHVSKHREVHLLSKTDPNGGKCLIKECHSHDIDIF
jgi:hypothetical protein